jgi:cardiolipin synthase
MMGHYLVSHLLTVITALGSALMVVRLLGTKRSPQSLLAWIVGLVFLPLVAIPLYFLFGARKFLKGKRGLALPPVREGQQLELLGDGVLAYRRLLALIADAKRSIDFTMFILGDDAVGWSVVDALCARANDGVQVRVVVDALGSGRIARRARRALAAAGAELRTFMPLLHAPLRGRNNLRLHRKVGVFDGEHVFLGGMNVAAEYMGPEERSDRWRDLAAVVSGDVAIDAGLLFESDWGYCGDKASAVTATPAANTGSATVQLVPSGPDMTNDTFYDVVLTAIFAAKTHIALVTPYYVPDESVQHALVLAARRGVRVHVVVPLKSNHALADFARRSMLRELVDAGAQLLFYPLGMVHAKAMRIDDDFAYVGSPNLDMRSFFLDYEDALCIHSPAHVAQVGAWIDALAAQSTNTGPRFRREYWLFEHVARMLAPEL